MEISLVIFGKLSGSVQFVKRRSNYDIRERHVMKYKSLYNGIIFIEGHDDSCRVMGNVEYKKDTLCNNQLKNLDNIKAQLAEKAKQLGANAVMDFKYGQKNISWIRSLLCAFDDNINWYASGVAVKLDDDKYEKYTEQIQSEN